MRVEIAGNIASGKTTLAAILSRTLTTAYEDFRTNPFWKNFYKNPVAHSFETEITFTLQHYHQIKLLMATNKTFVCDFSLILDRSYSDVTLLGKRRNLYVQLLEELEAEVGPPDILIFLTCGEEQLLDRIRSRGRAVESSITLDYLRNLTWHLRENLRRVLPHTDLLTLDSEALNFAHVDDVKREVRDLVLSRIQRRVSETRQPWSGAP